MSDVPDNFGEKKSKISIMVEILAGANIVFLILIIAFAIKLRLDFEELKKNQGKQERKDDVGRKFAELEGRLITLEDKILSLEYDTKELREKIAELKTVIVDIKESVSSFMKSKSGKEVNPDTGRDFASHLKVDKDTGSENSRVLPEHSSFHAYQSRNENMKNYQVVSDVDELVLKYASEGKTEEEIANILGLSYEEIKIILRMSAGRKK